MSAPDDPLLTPKQAAADLGLSLSAFWRGVAGGRLPEPFYPLPKSPRWLRSELRKALEGTRARPAEQKLSRRADRLGAKVAGAALAS